jgi:cytochrome c-type biogenesis protein CcmH
VRLVRAYAVLGEADRLRVALAAAQSRYAARPDILSQLKAASAPPAQEGGATAPSSAAMSPPARTP